MYSGYPLPVRADCKVNCNADTCPKVEWGVIRGSVVEVGGREGRSQVHELCLT